MSKIKGARHGKYTLEIAIIFPLLIALFTICIDYSIYLYTRASAIRAVSEIQMNSNYALISSPDSEINLSIDGNLSGVVKEVRNKRKLVDNWHKELDISNFEGKLLANFKNRMGVNLKTLKGFQYELNRGFLSNKWKLSYNFETFSLFKTKFFGAEKYLAIAKYKEGKEENIYRDMVNIDLCTKMAKNLDALENMASQYKTVISDLEEVGK